MSIKEYNFYYPILNNKTGELHAIKNLKHREAIIPIIDVTPNTVRPQTRNIKGKSVFVDQIRSVAKNIAASWTTENEIYVDVLPLNDEILSRYAAHPMISIFEYFRSTEFPAAAIPVIHLASTPNKRSIVKSICKLDGRGYMIRIRPTEIAGVNSDPSALKFALDEIMREIDSPQNEIDILIDLEELSSISHSIYKPIIRKIVNNFPYLAIWRRFIIGSGSFPTSINRIPYGSHMDFQRYDWDLWTSLIGHVDRIPAFADYTTVTPVVLENNTKAINVPPNTRYTFGDGWRVYRDESNMSKKNSNMYFHQCKRLISDKVIYKGPSYSAGDAEFDTCASYAGILPLPPKIGSGNSQVWRENDINHHIVFVSEQTKAVP